MNKTTNKYPLEVRKRAMTAGFGNSQTWISVSPGQTFQ